MDSDSLKILRKREIELDERIQSLSQQLRMLRQEADQVHRGIRAMTGEVIPASGHRGSAESMMHHRRNANREVQSLTFKELSLKALSEHFRNGATANELLEFFATKWGRNDVVRTSLSPQLSRLRQEGRIILEGKIWRLMPAENGEA